MAYEEDNLQMAVARYLDTLGILWTHVANERKSSPQAGLRLKKKGVKSGVPDVMIFESSRLYKGLAIELKIKKDNGFKKNGEPKKPTVRKLSDNQIEWLGKLKTKGWYACVCYSFDEVEALVKGYLKN